MAGPQLALCMTKGVLPPIQTEKIQGTSSWLSELVQGVLVPGCQQNARYDFACRDDGGGSAEGRSEARKNGMGGMGHGTWDMGHGMGWAWACSSSPEAVCMQSNGAALDGLYATSAAGQGDMQLCSYVAMRISHCLAWPDGR